MALPEPYTADSKSSWLAISFGCCASRRDSLDNDEGRAALRANGENEMQICYEQPQVVPQPRVEPILPRPSTSQSMSRHVSQWVSSGRDFATRASSRASAHTLSRPRRSQSKARPSIGRPTDFRRFDGLDGADGIQSAIDDAPMPVRRRRSFRPLELSIYMPDGRLSPLPDFSIMEWEERPVDLSFPAQALVRQRDKRTSSISSEPSPSSCLVQRKPVGSGSRRSSLQSQPCRPVSAALSALPFLEEEPKSRPESVNSNGPTLLQRSSTQSSLTSPNRILSRLPSPSRSRSSTSTSRPGSLRRVKTDVGEAIRELNTIVEERRADAYRSKTQSPALINRVPPSPSRHVPAIAPSMSMHVRSQTLSDIGSAFSVPLLGNSLPCSPPPPTSSPRKLTLSPPARSFTGPLTSNPITPPTPTVPTPTTPIHRLGAWIKRSLPTSPSSPKFFKSSSTSLPTTPKPTSSHSTAASASASFYACQPAAPPSRPSHASTRPSTAGSGTLAPTLTHTRQDSAETATVTLFSTTNSSPSTPALSTRSLSPAPSYHSSKSPTSPETPATPARANLLKGEGKTRKVPAPLILKKDTMVESPLASARSGRSTRSLKPPPSPHYNILCGMERTVAPGEAMKGRESIVSVSHVGVAF